jgi:uncharacterized protein with HEPN domain
MDAVCMRLSAAIESVAMIDDALRARAYGDAWPAIWSVRNRIAHGYLVVDYGRMMILPNALPVSA